MKMHPQDIFLDTLVFASTIHWFALAIERQNSWVQSLRLNGSHISQILKLFELIKTIVATGAMLRSFSQPWSARGS
jgi:hypothetical protein